MKALVAPLCPGDNVPREENGGAGIELRCLTDDQADVDRLLRLLGSIGAGPVHRLAGHAAVRLGDGTVPPPWSVVLLVSPERLDEGASTLLRLRSAWPIMTLFACTRHVQVAALERLLSCGASDFALLDDADAELALRLRHVLGMVRRRQPDSEGELCAEWLPSGLQSHLIGQAPAFVKALRQLPAMAASDANLLLLGETGTGKEVCAQAIHYQSARARGPWVATNCAAVPAELLEDELFGHVRGAFTHAVGARRGLVQEAEGGTLFLDEIDTMPLAAQAKLLRFLQDKQYRMVGSSEMRRANVRVVAASNRDLRLAAALGSFRQDLFYRLNVLTLTLPPLRERMGDIPLLAMHFLTQSAKEERRGTNALTPAALRSLINYAWPGNVRELRHVMQRAVLLATGALVQAQDIHLDGAPATATENAGESFRDAKARAVESFERQYLEQLLLQSQGNITRAARAAQKNRRAFFELLRRHGIEAAQYRAPD